MTAVSSTAVHTKNRPPPLCKPPSVKNKTQIKILRRTILQPFVRYHITRIIIGIETATHILEGYGFTANDRLTNYRILKPSGVFPFNPNAASNPGIRRASPRYSGRNASVR